jgi:anthranilate synthase component 1
MPRRSYTGSLGYINHDGSFDFNILMQFVARTELSFRALVSRLITAARELDEPGAGTRPAARINRMISSTATAGGR